MTGTFDNWSKSVKLQKDGDSFTKTVDIPSTTSAGTVHYKVRLGETEAPRLSGCSAQARKLPYLAPMLTISAQFVADGDWKHDPNGKTETDHEGNINNVIYPQDLNPSLSSAAMSSTGPEAT